VWNGEGYLNASGEAFFPQPGAAPDKLPQLAGPQGQGSKVLGKYRQVVKTLQPLGMQVTRLALDSRRAWTLQLDNGVQLRLGRTRPWHRLQRFVRAFPEVFAGRLAGVQRVDMRYSNGFSVYRQQAVLQGAVGQRDAAG
jgi:cell division protein FtsQ